MMLPLGFLQNIGPTELIVLLVIVLILFGGKKLPDLARSLGRNSLIGPDYKNVDFSVFKNTQLTDNVMLQLRFEFFNLFNHPNYSSPLLPGFSVDAGFNGISSDGRGIGYLPITVTPDVGVGNPFLGGGGSRNIQMGIRLVF